VTVLVAFWVQAVSFVFMSALLHSESGNFVIVPFYSLHHVITIFCFV
jgi:hypothetical protein